MRNNAFLEDLPRTSQAVLRSEALVTLVARSQRGAPVMPLVAGLILIGGDLDRHALEVGAGFVVAMALLAGVRLWLGSRHDAASLEDEPTSHRLYLAGLVGTLLLWGGFTMFTIHASGPAPLEVAAIGGVGMGLAVSTSIDRRLCRLSVVGTFVPPVLALLSFGTREAYALAALFGLGMFLVSYIGRVLHEDYWRSVRSLHLLKARARELEEARSGAEQAAGAKSAFLAAMSHELRTPLHGVIGMAELLRKTPLGTVQRRYTEIIASSADHLLGLINDVLDVSRIESGKIELEAVPFDLVELVEDVAELLATEASSQGLDLLVEQEPTAPRRVVGDPARVRQILTNLVSNAIKFTDDGHVLISVEGEGGEVRLSVTDTGIGITAETRQRIFEPFTQADASTTRRYGGTGLGLSICRGLVHALGGRLTLASEVGRGSRFSVTLPLPRVSVGAAPLPLDCEVTLIEAPGARRRVLEGALGGVGARVQALPSVAAALDDDEALAQADAVVLSAELGRREQRRLADHLGRTPLILISRTAQVLDEEVSAVLMQPYRRADLISCLELVLRRSEDLSGPVAVPVLPRSDDEEERAGRQTRRFSARVLIVEDNGVNRVVARQLLESLGCTADTVPDGAKAVEAAGRQRYDLILMDCQMPILDGYEATVAIRAAEGTGPRTPIVAMTASLSAAERDRAFAVGMDDWMEKPVRAERLADILSLLVAEVHLPA